MSVADGKPFQLPATIYHNPLFEIRPFAARRARLAPVI